MTEPEDIIKEVVEKIWEENRMAADALLGQTGPAVRVFLDRDNIHYEGIAPCDFWKFA